MNLNTISLPTKARPKTKKKKHSGKYQAHAGVFQRPYQTNNKTAKNTDRDWSLVVTMATKLVQCMVHWLMREFPSLLLGDIVIGWLFVFAGIFLLLLYSSLQMGVIDSPCAFITHLEVSVFFFPQCPQTESVRVRINWRRFCTGSFKL